MKKLLLATSLWAATVSAALAQSASFYGAADYGPVTYSGSGSYSSPGGLSLALGARLRPQLALEGGLFLIGNATADLPGPGRASIDQTIVTATVVASAPINSKVDLFGRAGLGVHNGEISGLPGDLILGFGGRVGVSRDVSLRLQYERLGEAKVSSSSSKADISRLSIGVTYDF